jgi:hypothetical protein
VSVISLSDKFICRTFSTSSLLSKKASLSCHPENCIFEMLLLSFGLLLLLSFFSSCGMDADFQLTTQKIIHKNIRAHAVKLKMQFFYFACDCQFFLKCLDNNNGEMLLMFDAQTSKKFPAAG